MPKQVTTWTDPVIRGMICGTVEERDTALRYIYVASGWREAAQHVLRSKGVASVDAKEAIQEAVIEFDRKIREGEMPEDAPLKAYFIGICKGKAFVMQRARYKFILVEDFGVFEQDNAVSTPEVETLKTEHRALVKRLLGYLDEHCRQLLMYYMLSFSMKEIRDHMLLKSDEATRKSAFDCRKKLAALLDKSPMWKQYFEGNNQRG